MIQAFGMKRARLLMSSRIIDPDKFGISFSLKQCRNFRLDGHETLNWLITEVGFRRLRLMSYWNEHEQQPGKYDFAALDTQFDMIEKTGGIVTLCLGARQPRWPETHWPDWAWALSKRERTEALLHYIEVVVERYKDRTCLVSYQLENEALNNFGIRREVDRTRLRAEYTLVKGLDKTRPVIMSTSNAWGLPARRPLPDIIGFSYYLIMYKSKKQRYSVAWRGPRFHRVRALLGKLLLRRQVFIHELQLEPWGPTAIWKMTSDQQAESMSIDQMKLNLRQAKRIGRYPIDLWGAEWWYWRYKHGDNSIWQTVKAGINT